MNPSQRIILASHLVLTGYAHWLPNDLRGSGSCEIRKPLLEDLCPILPGRQTPQPPKGDVRDFFNDADSRLEHKRLWFDASHHALLARGFAQACADHKYTLWALAICSNHAHAVVRTHRDKSETIWANLANASKAALLADGAVPAEHPVWSHRPYKVFLHTPDDVRGRIGYVNDNPEKEGLPRQHWECVVP